MIKIPPAKFDKLPCKESPIPAAKPAMMAANEVVCTPKVETADNMTKSLNRKSKIGIINSRIDGSIFLLIKQFLIIILNFCKSQKPIVKKNSTKHTYKPKEMMYLNNHSYFSKSIANILTLINKNTLKSF